MLLIPPIDLRPRDQMSPRRDTPGCALMLAWVVLVGWWMSLGTTIVAWVLVVSGAGAASGMRLLGRLPRIIYREAPTDTFIDHTAGVAESLARSPHRQRSVVGVVYRLTIGWWLSALILLVAWILVLTVAGIPVAQRLYVWVPRLATLADYDSPARSSGAHRE